MATSPPAAPTGSTSSALAAAPVLGPAAAQTLQAINIQMPPAPKLEWWEVQGVLPSIAAVIAVVITSLSLHWNTSRTLRSSRQTAEDQLDNARAEAIKQREHATEQAQRDRIIAARKSVYAELIDNYGKVLELIGAMPLRDPDAEPSPGIALVTMSSSVTKLWIWGEVETVEQIRELYTQVSELYYEARSRCYPIFNKKKLLRELEIDADRASGKHDAVRAELDNSKKNRLANLAFSTTPVEAELESDASLYFDQASRIHQEIFHENRELRKLIDAYDTFVIKKQSRLMEQVNRAMAAARTELGLGGNASVLDAQSEAMSRRAQEAIKKFRESTENPRS